MRISLAFIIGVLVLSACGAQTTASSPSAPSVAVTWTHQDQCQGAGFGQPQNPPAASLPGDFPIYLGVQAMFAPYDSGKGKVSAAWTVAGGIAGPQDWYKQHLQSGDFQLYGDQYSDPCGASYRFERRSNVHVGGFVSVIAGLAGPGKTLITMTIGPK